MENEACRPTDLAVALSSECTTDPCATPELHILCSGLAYAAAHDARALRPRYAAGSSSPRDALLSAIGMGYGTDSFARAKILGGILIAEFASCAKQRTNFSSAPL